MHNNALAHDYVIRAGKRQLAVEVLFGESSWADVVRECQEIVELLLRALLKLCRIEVSRFQDVSVTLEIHKDRIPETGMHFARCSGSSVEISAPRS